MSVAVVAAEAAAVAATVTAVLVESESRGRFFGSGKFSDESWRNRKSRFLLGVVVSFSVDSRFVYS